MSFKKRGGDAGLVEETPARTAARLADAFITAAGEVADSLPVEPPGADGRVFLGDSRDLSGVLADGGARYSAVTLGLVAIVRNEKPDTWHRASGIGPDEPVASPLSLMPDA